MKVRALEYEKRYQCEFTSAGHVSTALDSAASDFDPDELYRVGPSESQQSDRACRDRNFENSDWARIQNDDRNMNIRERVQKWNLSCDGTHDVLDFVEQVEEMAQIDRVPIDSVHHVVSVCLTGDALMWWRNRHMTLGDWRSFRASFLKFFLDPNFWENLEDQIRQRKQRPGESFKRYALVMEDMMRHTNMSSHEKLVRIHKNASPLVRVLLEPEQLTTLDQLAAKANYVELALGNEASTTQRLMVTQEPVRVTSHNTSGRYIRQSRGAFNPQEACRCCGQSGHFSRECRNPEVLFCWICGQKGRHTRNCCGLRNQDSNENRPNKLRLGGVKVVSTMKSETDNSIFFIGPPQMKNGTIAVMVKVGPREYPGIIDTGAGKSFVSTEAFRQMPDSITRRLKRVKTTVSLADGAKRKIEGIAKVSFTAGKASGQINLMVLEGAMDAIVLGIDYLQATNAELTTSCGRVKFGRNTAKLSDERTPVIRRKSTTDEQTPVVTNKRTIEENKRTKPGQRTSGSPNSSMQQRNRQGKQGLTAHNTYGKITSPDV